MPTGLPSLPRETQEPVHRTQGTASEAAAEAAHRRLQVDLEEGTFPSVRRSLQTMVSDDDRKKLAGSQVMQQRWVELRAKLYESVYLHDDDYYTAMKKAMYNVEWCLRTLVPWRMCMYPNDAPALAVGREPQPEAKPKGVYTRDRHARLESVQSYGYGRP